MKNFTQDRQFSGRDLKPGPPGYEVKESATKPPRSLTLHAVLYAQFFRNNVYRSKLSYHESDL